MSEVGRRFSVAQNNFRSSHISASHGLTHTRAMSNDSADSGGRERPRCTPGVNSRSRSWNGTAELNDSDKYGLLSSKSSLLSEFSPVGFVSGQRQRFQTICDTWSEKPVAATMLCHFTFHPIRGHLATGSRYRWLTVRYWHLQDKVTITQKDTFSLKKEPKLTKRGKNPPKACSVSHKIQTSWQKQWKV